jgi:hypothetical protein
MLTVAANSNRVRRTTEKSVEDYIGALLTSMGHLNWHTADKWQKGLPDRYVVGGNHIEFKSLVCKRSIDMLRFFDPAQIVKLDEIDRTNDRAFACAKVETPNGAFLILEEWHQFKTLGVLTAKQIEKRFAPYRQAVAVLRRWFP